MRYVALLFVFSLREPCAQQPTILQLWHGKERTQSVIWGCQYGPLRRLAVQMMLDLRQKSKKKRSKDSVFARKCLLLQQN